MITPDEVVAEILTILKADGPLAAAVGAEIREAQWKGTAFSYPNVRLQRVMLSPYGNGNCTPAAKRVQVTLEVASKKDSSKTAQEIQGLVQAALEGQRLDTSALVTISPLREQLLSPAAPDPETEIWKGSVTFSAIVKAR